MFGIEYIANFTRRTMEVAQKVDVPGFSKFDNILIINFYLELKVKKLFFFLVELSIIR